MLRSLLVLPLFLLANSSYSVLLSAKPPQSPEVHSDGTVTFRAVLPEAKEVHVELNRVKHSKVELSKGDEDIWSGTSQPLDPGIYEYMVVIDGASQVDKLNRWYKEWYTMQSLLEVPGEPPLVTESQSVPHGVLHHHLYRSPITKSDRSVVVYTPPGYDEKHDQEFPVLFLFHGFGDDQTAWTEVGRTHLIADNLIADDKMKEMVIVMPHGHFVPLPYGEQSDEEKEAYGKANNPLMLREINDVLLPWVCENYRVVDSPESRAITGLSMGGGHSLRTAFSKNHFAWVGAFSAAAPEDETPQELSCDLEQFKQQLKLLWIACGDEDFLLERNQTFVKSLEQAGIPHQYLETKGSHNWDVWRDDYLPQFLPLLFQ